MSGVVITWLAHFGIIITKTLICGKIRMGSRWKGGEMIMW